MKYTHPLRKPKIFRLLTVLLLRIYILIFLKFKVSKQGNLPKGPKIFAINHPTTTDPFIIYCMFPNARVLIDKDIFNIKILGWAFNKLGHIPVDKTNGRLAYNSAKEVLLNGEDIILFPEGFISKSSSKVRDLKTGLARLAIETRAPIIPIGISIEEKSIKRYKTKLTNKKTTTTRWYMFGNYRVNIGRSIRIKGNIKNREFVTRKTRYLQDEIQKLSRK